MAGSSDNPVLGAFDATGAYLRGHFRLTSGLHSPEYLQCALVLQYPEHAERFGRMIAGELRRLVHDAGIDMVVSPALGGLIIGHETARALGCRFLFTERDAASGRMALRRGFHVAAGESAVVVEDVVTTGGSTREVIETLRSFGANVLAAGCIIDRSGGAADLGIPKAALATLSAQTFQPEACPLCASGIPVLKPGSRAA